ncbi:type II toxin-antitoxin system PemK/MazF family toxin [Methanogenium sp. S4BF]|uniref:type II toxin-antitoxin system PemK/MazF family toxin n=1 Tax=Methanogenium sp. S4BF TaxID=1789226 RepID=UPI0024172424|nr:type II toxin-antitoxin system PemK/MazF family toxin [Methanogenium sp. S4BF]WFN35583.1 type II toxin-antitoxin system PemK/MazF family toxin [Methanogenium sp. S4BF]
MKGCRPGDIILAPFRLGNSTYPRPLVILAIANDEDLQVCPVTSRRPSDTPAMECSIHHFQKGGLDLFEDSYILLHETGTIRKKSIRSKKGTLEPDYFTAVLERVRADI